MKLKKSESSAETSGAATGGATIAARFQLDLESQPAKKAPAGVGKKAALIALIAATVALGLVAFSAFMMYSDWAISKTT